MKSGYYYYQSIKNALELKFEEISNGYYEDRKSKFYSYIFNINNDVEAESIIRNITTENKDARHIVYIYTYLENGVRRIKFSDDGEPQKTGTKAIYDFLIKENIVNTLVVIVRYFGGVLLGAGPLARAYFNAFKDSTKNLELTSFVIYKDFEFSVKYEKVKDLDNMLKEYISNKLVIINEKVFKDDITYKVKISEDIIEEIKEKINTFL